MSKPVAENVESLWLSRYIMVYIHMVVELISNNWVHVPNNILNWIYWADSIQFYPILLVERAKLIAANGQLFLTLLPSRNSPIGDIALSCLANLALGMLSSAKKWPASWKKESDGSYMFLQTVGIRIGLSTNIDLTNSLELWFTLWETNITMKNHHF